MIKFFLCGFIGEAGYSLSIVVEDDRGVVYDLWGEYYGDYEYVTGVKKLLGAAINLVEHNPELVRGSLTIYICKNVAALFRSPKYIDKLLEEIIVERLGNDIKLSIKKIDLEEYKRGYSLALKAYNIRGRYPPKI